MNKELIQTEVKLLWSIRNLSLITDLKNFCEIEVGRCENCPINNVGGFEDTCPLRDVIKTLREIESVVNDDLLDNLYLTDVLEDEEE